MIRSLGTEEVRKFFQNAFGSLPSKVVRAPGRLELLGNHTDYNGGLVMALAVDKYVYFAASPRSDAEVELVTTSFPQREKFYLDKIEKNDATAWANYTKGVLLKLKERGVHFTGFNGAIHGTIPFGAGLSSSAALEMASALIVRAMFPYRLLDATAQRLDRTPKGEVPAMDAEEKLRVAKIGQAAESEFVGVHCGLLDQISSLFGKAGQVIQIDFLTNNVQHTPMPSGIDVVVADSAVKHDLSSGEYNQIRAQCESAATKLGVKLLRQVDPRLLDQNKGKLTEREYQCAYHIVGENQRVIFGERALREGDIEQFGQYLYQSHESSRDFFKNSTSHLDELVEIARRQSGCHGARLTGGGFGGATINLVERERTEEFKRNLADEYFRKTKIQTQPWVAQVVDGAE